VRLGLGALQLKLRSLRASPRTAPERLFLGLTNRCQLRCPHCGIRGVPEVTDMPLPKALRLIREASSMAIPRIILFGGEPLLYPHLEEVMRCAAGLGLFVELDTNGLAASATTLERLARAGLCALRVSLHSSVAKRHDALQRRAGSFDAVRKVVRAARKAGLLAYLSTCVFNETLDNDDVNGIAALARKWGASGIRMISYAPIEGETSAKHAARTLLLASQIVAKNQTPPVQTCLPEADSSDCVATLGHQIYIAPSGDISICPYARKPLGNVRSASLRKFWRAQTASLRPKKRYPCCLS